MQQDVKDSISFSLLFPPAQYGSYCAERRNTKYRYATLNEKKKNRANIQHDWTLKHIDMSCQYHVRKYWQAKCN